MHLFIPAVGLKKYTLRPTLDNLIKDIINEAIENKKVITSSKMMDDYYDAQIDKPMVLDSLGVVAGLTIRGLYNNITKDFKYSFAFPYVEGRTPYFNSELIFERQRDKEAFMVHCNEVGKDIAPIFFLRNIVEYMKKFKGETILSDRLIWLSALAISGKIILPIRKTTEQIVKYNAATKEKEKLMDKALSGDIEAIDKLAINEYETISQIYERIKTEDVYSIVDSSFIPSGLECDSYSVVGNIESVSECKNIITNEIIYFMKIECNNIEMEIAINKEDLIGEPKAGYRFIGKIWLQGNVFID